MVLLFPSKQNFCSVNVFLIVFLLQQVQTIELKKDGLAEKPIQIVVTPVENSIPEDVEEEEEEKEEEEDDVSVEFSFAKFSAMHFQYSATHTHIQQRLKHPLLYHEDEGDTLVSVPLSFLSFYHYTPPSFHLVFHFAGLSNCLVDHLEVHG